jgi:hypothetical protein
VGSVSKADKYPRGFSRIEPPTPRTPGEDPRVRKCRLSLSGCIAHQTPIDSLNSPESPSHHGSISSHEPRLFVRVNSGNRTGQWRDVDGGRQFRDRSGSMPPDNRHHHDHRQGWTPVSGNSSWSWSWANSLRIPGHGLVEVQAQVQVDEQWVVHHGQGHMGRDRGGHRSRNLIHPPPTPIPAPRRTFTPSPVDSPVIPGVTTAGAMCFRNLLRKRSDSRPKILFYNKHEPHYGFTNFSPHSVLYHGKRYPTSEHLFQSLKVRAWLPSCFCFCLLSCGSLPPLVRS